MELYIAGPSFFGYFTKGANTRAYCETVMKMYLAAPNSGPAVREYMQLYLGAPHSGMKPCMDEYLASSLTDSLEELAHGEPYILESFFYVDKWMFPFIDKKAWNFMLDSGAYTFMTKRKEGSKFEKTASTMDWDDYVERYAEFILEHGVTKFFELDIDAVVGLKRVEKLRAVLEQRTGQQCIPVWHKARGLANWQALIKDYPYVAIGGIVSGEIKRSETKYLTAMCDLAHEQGTLVHGLGVSPSTGMELLRFDSVDSTGWTMGNRAGHLDFFTGSGMRKVERPEGKKMDARLVALNNFREWLKYQRYMLHAGWKMES